MEDLADLEELTKAVKANSLCGLGQTASNPILSTMAKFKDEYIAHIVDKKCPAHVCKKLMNYVIDKEKCIGCGICTTKCEFDAIKLYREHPECSKMTPSEDKLKYVLPNGLKQRVKVAFKHR